MGENSISSEGLSAGGLPAIVCSEETNCKLFAFILRNLDTTPAYNDHSAEKEKGEAEEHAKKEADEACGLLPRATLLPSARSARCFPAIREILTHNKHIRGNHSPYRVAKNWVSACGKEDFCTVKAKPSLPTESDSRGSSFAYNGWCRVGEVVMDLHEMSGPVREFTENILRVFPEWESALECPGKGDGTGDCSFCIVPPAHPTHRLYVVARGNSVEVRYADAKPPGPAEKLFVDLDQNPREVAEAVAGFVRDIISGRVVVVRERLPRFARWIRHDCDSSVSFRGAGELKSSRRAKVIALYSWTTIDQNRAIP